MNDETKKRISHLMTVSEVKQSPGNTENVIRFKDRNEAIAAICARLFGAKPVYDEDEDHSEDN